MLVFEQLHDWNKTDKIPFHFERYAWSRSRISFKSKHVVWISDIHGKKFHIKRYYIPKPLSSSSSIQYLTDEEKKRYNIIERKKDEVMCLDSIHVLRFIKEVLS